MSEKIDPELFNKFMEMFSDALKTGDLKAEKNQVELMKEKHEAVVEKVDKAITDGLVLDVSPQSLVEFFKSGATIGMTSQDAHYAKQYFKSKLDWKAEE